MRDAGSISPVTLIDAGADQTFAGVAVAFAGNEGELFFAETSDGGYVYLLQHLSAGGTGVDSPVTVAFGAPTSPPNVAVSSDGIEISACWEDYGLDPNVYGSCAGTDTVEAIVKCNSVPLAGTSTDLALDGGYVGCGVLPILGQGLSAAYGYVDITLLTYVQPTSDGQIDNLYCDWGDSIGTGSGSSPLGMPILASAAGYWMFLGASDEVTYGELDLVGGSPCYGYSSGSLNGPVISYDGGQAFSVTTRADDAGTQIGVVVSAESVGVVGLVLDDPSTGVTTSAVTLNTADETPLGPVALAGCGSEFWYAYAVDGGNVIAGAFGPDGALLDGGTLLVANLGANANYLSMATSDGGVLLAVGTAAEIGVYFVPCP
jgi:hypothetical protein